jgi:hypothetical protein|tara:strand:- start:127 stop:465 length:339 start_codon:yes stop_codon:yes gene_type:complete
VEIQFLRTIKDFLGFGWGVSQLIIGIIALQTLLLCLFVIFLHRGMITVLQRGLLDLDNKIAAAIQNLMSGELNLPEPINPMQQMIMSIIQQKMQPTNEETPIRDISGKFKGA